MTIDEPRPGKSFGRSYGTSNLIHDVPKKSVKGIAALVDLPSLNHPP